MANYAVDRKVLSELSKNKQEFFISKVPEFYKHLKKAGGYIGRNVMEITIKIKTLVRKPLMIKINKLHLRNLDN